MSAGHDDHGGKKPWPAVGAKYLSNAESAVLIVVGGVLVVLALVMMFYAIKGGVDVIHAVSNGVVDEKTHEPMKFGDEAIAVLNDVLLVMMTMEIVYTVAISLESHTLSAEPFLLIGCIAGIRRMLVITATSKEEDAAQFFNKLVELGLLAATVVALTFAIWILKKSAQVDRETELMGKDAPAPLAAHDAHAATEKGHHEKEPAPHAAHG